jgi:hypothetical protein
MALIILEGLDRTGKSTIASYYEAQGYEVIHLSAPPKGITTDQYLQDMVDIVSMASTRDIIMDRSHYGEAVWPFVYGRSPILNEEEINVVREIEDSIGTKRILMYDSNLEAHWKRCVDNNEPLTKTQFSRARGLFSQMAQKYGFELVTLQNFIKQFPDAESFLRPTQTPVKEQESLPVKENSVELSDSNTGYSLTAEQKKLERANAINDILSKRILKPKNGIYDELENEIRLFLNTKLGKLFGGNVQELSLTPEEIKFYKTMFKRATEKQ